MRYALPSMLALLIAAAVAPAPRPAGNLYPLRVLDLHDADTLRADIDLGFDVTLSNQPIRLLGFDAWEVSRARRTVTVTPAEIVRGKEAARQLAALMDGGEAYLMPPPASDQKDPYGRGHGYLFICRDGDWLDVAKWAHANGHDRN